MIEYAAGNYVYAIRSTTEKGSLAMHHPDEDALREQGFRLHWADHTGDGDFYVFRREMKPRSDSSQPGATPGERDGAGRPEAPGETVVASSCGARSAMRERAEALMDEWERESASVHLTEGDRNMIHAMIDRLRGVLR